MDEIQLTAIYGGWSENYASNTSTPAQLRASWTALRNHAVSFKEKKAEAAQKYLPAELKKQLAEMAAREIDAARKIPKQWLERAHRERTALTEKLSLKPPADQSPAEFLREQELRSWLMSRATKGENLSLMLLQAVESDDMATATAFLYAPPMIQQAMGIPPEHWASARQSFAAKMNPDAARELAELEPRSALWRRPEPPRTEPTPVSPGSS